MKPFLNSSLGNKVFLACLVFSLPAVNILLELLPLDEIVRMPDFNDLGTSLKIGGAKALLMLLTFSIGLYTLIKQHDSAFDMSPWKYVKVLLFQMLELTVFFLAIYMLGFLIVFFSVRSFIRDQGIEEVLLLLITKCDPAIIQLLFWAMIISIQFFTYSNMVFALHFQRAGIYLKRPLKMLFSRAGLLLIFLSILLSLDLIIADSFSGIHPLVSQLEVVYDFYVFLFSLTILAYVIVRLNKDKKLTT